MKSLTKFALMTGYFLLLGIVGQAFAQPMVVGTPSFIDPQNPEFYVCQRVNMYYDCTPEAYELGDFIPVTFRMEDGSEQKVRVPAVVKVTCLNGLCLDEGDNYHGEIDYLEETPMHIPQGYYVYQPNRQVKPSVWRWGHGPLGGQFPALQTVDPIEHKSLGDLWCSLQEDVCAYQGEEYTRAQLPEVAPFADVNSESGDDFMCQFESCYNDDGEFIGLNPFYVDYQH